MKLSIISFTKNGKQLSERLSGELGMETVLYTKCGALKNDDADSLVMYEKRSVSDWAKEQFLAGNAVLFIGACGIAVRAVAPHLTDKLHDVPALVMDELGLFVIPILSGHMGGANELARLIAGKIGAEPVITTATDLNQKFAVDLFAKRNGLSIVQKDGIAKVSSKILAGEEITISIETGHKINGPGGNEGREWPWEEVLPVPYPPVGFVDVVISSEEREFDTALLLKPKEYIIGMGCKKGKTAEEIDCLITKKTKELGIFATQIYALASISQKKEEPGLIEWCKRTGILFLTYTAQELQKAEGNFTGSSFVKAQVGVDNVCERAALMACGGAGKLILPKYAENGMTIAAAKRDWSLSV